MERLHNQKTSAVFSSQERLNPLSSHTDPAVLKDLLSAAAIITTVITSLSYLMYRRGWFGKIPDQKNTTNKSPESSRKTPNKK